MSLALAIGGVALATMGVAAVWQRNAKAHYRSLFRAEAARLHAERRYRITLMSVGDGVISTDTAGRVEVLNPVAEALTGWGQEDARGKPLEEVFPIVNEYTRRLVENPVRRVIREGIIVGLANHTLLIARDKTERPIADAAAPIRDDSGAITGTVLVFRDQTQEREVQRKLREGKARLDLALQAAEMGAWSWEVAAHKRRFDEQSCRLLGLEPKTFGGTQEEFFERVHPEDLETVKSALARTLESDVLYETDYRVIWPDGSTHHISSRARLERDDQGLAAKVNGVLWEVTVRKLAEDDLRASRQRLLDIIETTPAGYFFIDPEGCYRHVNPAWLRMHGFSALEEVVGLHFSTTHAEFNRQAVEEMVARVLAGEPMHSGEFSRRLKEGSIGWQSCSVKPVVQDGEIIGMEGFLIDTTQARQAEQVLRRSQAELEAIYDGTPIMMCLVNRKREVERINRSLAEFIGYSGSELRAQGPGDLVGCINALDNPSGCGHGLKCPQCPLRLAMMDTFLTGKPRRQIQSLMSLARKTMRREIQVSASTSLVQIQGEPKVIVCLQDVTAQKELEAQLLQAQKMEAVGQLAGGIAHDFNNILAAMLLHLQLLQLNSGLTPEICAELKELEDGTQRATSLTRQLLVFSRRHVMQSKRLDLNRLLGDLSKMLKRLLGEQIALSFIPSTAPAHVEADPGMLEQVVVNLCVNARDAMPHGGPLAIRTEPVRFSGEELGRHASRRAGAFVRLTVADAGCGMDETTLKRAFEPFFTTKAPGKGTGLGLATVYGIIKQHRGWVEVQSAPGRGSTFSVYLPAVSGGEERAPAAAPASLRTGSEVILLVEDDEIVRKLVLNSLKLQGYQVIEAGDGAEALRKWKECDETPNLLLSDMIMPGGTTGIELARRLRELKPGLRVIISSGYSADLLNRDEQEVRGIHFLPKPYDLRTLAAAVRRCLDSQD